MAIILDKYAIKEVADVMFYELDSKGAPSAPVLYLDTLKTSTLSQSSETVDATGGKGNVKLLSWDTNKELTLELEDALFSAKSLGIMFGGTMKDNGSTQEVLKTLKASEVSSIGTSASDTTKNYWKFTIKDVDYAISKDSATYFVYNEGETDPTATTKATTFDFITFDLLDCTKVGADGYAVARSAGNGIVRNGITIDITSNFNSNTYYITGDTYARNFQSGQDEFLQFIVPKGKVSAEDVSLTMEADGDPATFSMTVNCLKANDGSMVKLVKYSLGEAATGDAIPNKGVASVLDHYNGANQRAEWANPVSKVATSMNEGAEADWTDEG
jgi:hypothetical protein